jgi:hypothetical protein
LQRHQQQAALPIPPPDRPRAGLNLVVAIVGVVMLAPLVGFVLFFILRKRRTMPKTNENGIKETAPDRVTFACSVSD